MQDYKEKLITMLNKFFLTIDAVEIMCFLENHKSLRQREYVFCWIMEVNTRPYRCYCLLDWTPKRHEINLRTRWGSGSTTGELKISKPSNFKLTVSRYVEEPDPFFSASAKTVTSSNCLCSNFILHFSLKLLFNFFSLNNQTGILKKALTFTLIMWADRCWMQPFWTWGSAGELRSVGWCHSTAFQIRRAFTTCTIS